MMNAAAAAPLRYAANPRPPGRAANDNEELIIDLFAGGGGASEAILEVTGRHTDIAVNHDPEAIALHSVNHPTTMHLCEDIRKVVIPDILAKFQNRRVGLMWASPDCKHHSKARGGKPKDKNIRGLAWEVLRWAAAIKKATGHLPRVIGLENVEEFQHWCDVDKGGKVIKEQLGETFKLWVGHLYALGFTRIEWRELVAADHGAPTTRKRLFLVCLAEDQGQQWPKATYVARPKLPTLAQAAQGDLFGPPVPPALETKKFRSAAEIIEWDRPIPSIFGRPRELKPKTRARIAKGIKRYVIESARPFLVKVTHTKSSDAAQSIDEPLHTVTTAKGGEFALAAPTLLPVTHHGSDDRVYDVDDPARTITAANRGEQALASAFLKPRYGEREGQAPRALDIEGPMPTVVPTGNGADLAAVYLGRQFGTAVGRDLESPHPTVMTDGAGGKSYLVAAHLGRQFGRSVGSDIEEPVGTVTAGGGGKTQLIGATIIGTDNHSTRASRAFDPTDPLRTVTSGGGYATAAAFMAQHNGGRIGRAVDEPLTTMTHRGTQQQVVAPIIDKYYGNTDAQHMDEPLDTVTAKDRFGLAAAYMEQANTGMVGHDMTSPVSTLVGKGCTQRLVSAALEQIEAVDGRARRQVLEFLWEHFGEPTDAEWEDPIATAAGRLKFGLVLIEGMVWQIVDIGMRMLVPRELYRAQGFSDDYVIEITFNGKPLTKTAQTRMAGNSVSPPCAAAVLRAFLPPEMQLMRMAA